MARPSVVLPEPDFADHAERLALAHLDADAVDRLDVADGLARHAALDRKPDLQVVGLQHDLAGGIGLQGVRMRLGGEQRPGVGVLRRLEDFGDGIFLDDLAVLHHADPVGDLADDAEVVGDEQHGHAEPGLQLLEKLEDLRLDGDIERGGRLVGDQQVRLVGERHRDHHALALAAGQLMRIALQPRFGIGDADLRQQFEDARARRRAGHAAMQEQDFADLLLDRVQRIERGHRLLEDDGDVGAANLANVPLGQAEQILALEHHLAGRMARRRIRQQLHDRQRGRRFSRSRLADQRQRLALLDAERDAIDRQRRASTRAECDRQFLDGEQRLGGHIHAITGRSCADRRRRAPPRR